MAKTQVFAPPLAPADWYSPWFYSEKAFILGPNNYATYSLDFSTTSAIPSTFIVQVRYFKDGQTITEQHVIPGEGNITFSFGDDVENAQSPQFRVKSLLNGQQIEVDAPDQFRPYWGPDKNADTGGTDRTVPIDNLEDLFAQAELCPIVLDLDGDGIEYVSKANSNVYFDIDNDQFAEHVEWIKGDDGFLVRDINGDGKINNVTEMFGENGGTTGYQKLKLLDTNNDNKLSSADTAWASLKVWQDANQNGGVDTGELKSLASLNIASVSAVGNSDTISGGHAVAGTSTYTLTNATTRVTAGALFDTDQVDSWYIGNGATAPSVSFDTLFLPLSRGYGTLPSLHYAMTQDTALKTLVQNFNTLNGSLAMTNVYAKVEEIVHKWAGVSSVAVGSRGGLFDARDLGVIEKVMGQPYSFNGTTANPPGLAVLPLGAAYFEFMDTIVERLLVQGPLKTVFKQATYDFPTDKIELGDTLATLLANAQAYDPAAGTANYTAYWNEISRILTNHASEFSLAPSAVKAMVDEIAGYSTTVVTMFGGAGNDSIEGDGGFLQGTQPWNGVHDVFFGGAGADTLGGGNGNDIYLFGNETGNDLVRENSHIFADYYDAFVFNGTINAAQVNLSKVGNNLVVTIPSISNRTITMEDHFQLGLYGGRSNYHNVEEIRFANGEVWGLSTIDSVALGGARPVTLTGTSGNDLLTPNSAHVNVTGNAGADTFVINAAVNKFITITDYKSSQGDLIDITAFDVSWAQLNVRDLGGHAVFTLPDGLSGVQVNISNISSGQLIVSNFLSNTLNYGTGVLQYGTAGNDTIQGTLGNDSLFGNEGADYIVGGTGNDSIYGWIGNDTIFGGYGQDTLVGDDGNDSLIGDSGNDSLYGGAGADVIRGGAGNDYVNGDIGNDSIYGDDGNDDVFGSDGDDSVFGDGGNDTVGGGIGNDTVYGWTGNDNVFGGDGQDFITGDAGFDYLAGENGHDSLYGGDDADTLVGGAGNDYLDGGAGADYFTFNAGTGLDTVQSFEGEGIAGGDVLFMQGISGFSNFASVAAVTTYNSVNATATITLSAGNVITLTGVTQNLTADDFLFG